MQNPIIHATGIAKSYGSQTVLSGVDITVPEGTVTALLGPNGAGKTTLVRILTTLTTPDSGTATIAGFDLRQNPDKVRSVISLAGQYAAVDESLTGEENLLLMTRLWHLDRRTGARRRRDLLERFGLMDARNKPVGTYSGGMRRKLDLALSLVGNPRIIFLDEPTTGLDPRSRATMWDMVKELTATGVTIFLTTQYLEEADQLADSIVMIDGGRVIAKGTAEELKYRIASDVLELQFPDRESAARAASVIGPNAVVHATKPDSLNVASNGHPDQLRLLLNALASQHIVVAKVAINKPTLDDVFLELTGRAAGVVTVEAA